MLIPITKAMKIGVYLEKRGTEKEINKKPGLNFRESRQGMCL